MSDAVGLEVVKTKRSSWAERASSQLRSNAIGLIDAIVRTVFTLEGSLLSYVAEQEQIVAFLRLLLLTTTHAVNDR